MGNVVTDPNVIAAVQQQRNQAQTNSASGPASEDGLVGGATVVNDPNIIKAVNQRKADLNDDSWGAYFSDLAFSMRGFGYGVGDELTGIAGGDIEAYKQREELARLRSPVGSFIGEIAAGAAVDYAAYTGAGALAGSVIPVAGTAAGGVAGAAAATGKTLWRIGKGINRIKEANTLAARAAKLGAVGAAHGGAYGFGETDGSFGERIAGAADAALLGGAFGPAAVYGGRALQGAANLAGRGKARLLTGAHNTLVNNPSAQYAIAQDLTNQINQRLPQAAGKMSKNEFAALLTEATGDASYAWNEKTKQLYKQLDDSGAVVDIKPWQDLIGRAVKKYDNLAGGGKAAQTLRTLTKGDTAVSLEDARFIREQLFNIKHTIKNSDFDMLYKGITGQMRKGATNAGAGSIFEQADKFYREGLETFKGKMFKQGLSQEGFKPAFVRQAVVGENNGKYLEAIRSHFDDLAKNGQDVTKLRNDFAGLTINELMKKDGSVLRQLVDNSPDQGRDHLMALTGNKGLTDMLIKLGSSPKGKAPKDESILGGVFGGPVGGAVGLGTVTGYVDPVVAMAGLAVQIGRKKFAAALRDSPALQRKVAQFAERLKTKKLSPEQVTAQTNSLKAEILAAIGAAGGLYAFSEDIPDWVFEPTKALGGGAQ